jgi:protoporphyrin/coproporphyrin ferrochelatase
MIGILLTNLGTPDAPTAPAVRRYLAQFLSDPRVVQIPRAIWLPILYGPILTFRPKKSAAKYAKIWTPEGSPLKVYTERQTKLLKGLFGQRGWSNLSFAYAMRYGNPSIADGLEQLRQAGAARIVVLPLYPQWAGSTSGSTHDAVAAWQKKQPQLSVHIINNYHDHPAYIRALAASVREHTERLPTADKAQRLVMSFHGIPQQVVDQGDPYAAQCQRTANLLAAELRLDPTHWQLTFQSRFGRAKWLQPYTQATIESFAQQGVRTIDVICPGFASDCLETLEEIQMEVRDAFQAKGGQTLRLIPCLNDSPRHIEALAEILAPHIQS